MESEDPVNNATFDPWVQKLCGASPRIENDDVPKIKAAAFNIFVFRCSSA